MTKVERFWLHILAARTHHIGLRHELAQRRAEQAVVLAEDLTAVAGVFGDSNRTWLGRLDFARNVHRITMGATATPSP